MTETTNPTEKAPETVQETYGVNFVSNGKTYRMMFFDNDAVLIIALAISKLLNLFGIKHAIVDITEQLKKPTETPTVQ